MNGRVLSSEMVSPHPHPSASLQVFPCPQGEGLKLQLQPSHQPVKGHDQVLLLGEKGGDEGLQSLMKSRARSLRRNSTDAEIILWQHLRDSRLLGYKFRRQVPIGKYIVDFLCEDKAIIIELDGGQHMERESYDQIRTDWLEAYGFRVLRFWNNDVMGNTDAVLERLLSFLQKHLPAKKP